MAAGLGFKTFTTGEVLTAADTNGYLMQGILVFASEAARDAAITSPQEGQFAFTKDNNTTWFYDSATWVVSGAGGGKVLQVVSGTTTTQTVSVSQTMADTTLTASITPTLATSKVLILVTQHMLAERFAEAAGAGLRIMRDATAILTWEGSALSGSNYLYQRIRVNSVDADRNTFMGVTGMSYLDSPATTSATTYKTQFRIGASGSSASAIAQYDSGPSTITLLEIGV
jgi:hypothetical protein